MSDRGSLPPRERRAHARDASTWRNRAACISLVLGIWSVGCSYQHYEVRETPPLRPHDSRLLEVPGVGEFYTLAYRVADLQRFAEPRASEVQDRQAWVSQTTQIISAVTAFVSALLVFIFWRPSQERKRERRLAFMTASLAFVSSLVAIVLGTRASPEPLRACASAFNESFLEAQSAHDELIEIGASDPGRTRRVAVNAARALRGSMADPRERLQALTSADEVQRIEDDLGEIVRAVILGDRMSARVEAEIESALDGHSSNETSLELGANEDAR